MAQLSTIMLSTLTENTRFAGTDSRAVLIIIDDGTDVLHQVVPRTAQADLERGDANLYAIGGIVPLVPTVESANLTNSSVRLGLLGPDMWAPRHCFVWGYNGANGGPIPVAMDTEIDQRLSADTNREGRISLPVPLVGLGGDDMTIQGLMIVLRTANIRWAGTNSRVTFNVNTDPAVSPPPPFVVPNTPQRDLERAEANMYFMPVAGNPQVPLTKSSITGVSVTISGGDMWAPQRMHIFGLDVPAGGANQATPTSVVPLVDIRNWPNGANLPRLSTDAGEGSATVNLPLVA